MGRKKIGELYVEKGLLSEENKAKVLEFAQKKNLKFLDAVQVLDILPISKMIEAFGDGYKFDLYSIDLNSPPMEFIVAFNRAFIAKHGVLLLGKKVMKDGEFLYTYGLLNPLDLKNEELRNRLETPHTIKLIEPFDLMHVLENHLKFSLAEHFKAGPHSIHPRLRAELTKQNALNEKSLNEPGINARELNQENEKTKSPKNSAESPSESASSMKGKKVKISNGIDPMRYQVQRKGPRNVRDSISSMEDNTKFQSLYEIQIDEIENSINAIDNNADLSLGRDQPRLNLIATVLVNIPGKEKEKMVTLDISTHGLKLCGANINHLEKEKTYRMELKMNTPEKVSIFFEGKIAWLGEINEVNIAGVKIEHISNTDRGSWDLLLTYTGFEVS